MYGYSNRERAFESHDSDPDNTPEPIWVTSFMKNLKIEKCEYELLGMSHDVFKNLGVWGKRIIEIKMKKYFK